VGKRVKPSKGKLRKQNIIQIAYVKNKPWRKYICNNLPVQDRTGKYCGASEMSVKKSIRRESKDGSKGKSVHTGKHRTRKPERILITDA
jgi:hypothetical protein